MTMTRAAVARCSGDTASDDAAVQHTHASLCLPHNACAVRWDEMGRSG